MKNYTIQRATVEQVQELQQIGLKTFLEAFLDQNKKENIDSYTEVAFTIPKLRVELENKDSEFYFLRNDDELIGYLKLNFGDAQSVETNLSESAEIERIYLSKDYYGKALGKILFNKAKAIAQQKSLKHIWLGVWEENTRAINFYKKLGFEEFDSHIFLLGDEEQTDIMMRMEVRAE